MRPRPVIVDGRRATWDEDAWIMACYCLGRDDMCRWCSGGVWIVIPQPRIRIARRARRRALLRRIREDRRPTGGRWYGRHETPRTP